MTTSRLLLINVRKYKENKGKYRYEYESCNISWWQGYKNF